MGEGTLATGLNLLINAGETLGQVLRKAADSAQPIVSAVADLGEEGGAAAGTLDIIATVANTVMGAVSGMSFVLVPIGHIVGGIVSASVPCSHRSSRPPWPCCCSAASSQP